MGDLSFSYNANAPEEVKQQSIDKILSALPRHQRRPIEDYFGFISEASISEEIVMNMEAHGFTSIAEYEAALTQAGTGQTPRSLAIAELMGH